MENVRAASEWVFPAQGLANSPRRPRLISRYLNWNLPVLQPSGQSHSVATVGSKNLREKGAQEGGQPTSRPEAAGDELNNGRVLFISGLQVEVSATGIGEGNLKEVFLATFLVIMGQARTPQREGRSATLRLLG